MSVIDHLPPLPAAMIGPEFVLLRACSYSLPEERETQLPHVHRLLQQPLDCDAFCALVRFQRVNMLVDLTLRHVAAVYPDVQGVVDAIVQQIAPVARRFRLLNLLLHGELQRVTRLFESHGISSKVLKGTELSLRLYGDIGVRQMKDIDLVVQPRDLERATALLREAGYGIDVSERTSRGISLRLLQAIGWHFECIHPKNGVMIELHWRIEHMATTSLNDRWRPWLEHGAGDRAGLYELLYLCQHAAHHDWGSLRWLADLRVLFARLDVEKDWQPLLDLAAELRLEEILAISMAITAAVLFWQPPPAALALMERHRAGLQHSLPRALDVLAGNVHGHGLDHVHGVGGLWDLFVPEDRRYVWHERLRQCLWVAALSQTDIETLRLPGALVWLYPLIRPFSLTWRFVRSQRRRAAAAA